MAEKDEKQITEEVGDALDDLFGDVDMDSGDFQADTQPLSKEAAKMQAALLAEDEEDLKEEEAADFLDPPPAEEETPPQETPKPKTVKSEEGGISAEGLNDTEGPLKELKATLLSMDWEINDENMASFFAEVDSLKTMYMDDKILQSFLLILDSVMKYVNKKKANAHPDSIKYLHSIFNNLEKVLIEPDMPESEKKKLLASEITNFKQLKKLIILNKMDKKSPNEMIAYALDEIKKTIKAEFAALRQELKGSINED